MSGVMPPTAPQPLSYSPDLLSWRRRKRMQRSLVIATVLAIALVTYDGSPQISAWWMRLSLQRQYLGYVAPPDRVILEADETKAAALLTKPGYSRPPSLSN